MWSAARLPPAAEDCLEQLRRPAPPRRQGCVYKIGRRCPPGFVGGDLGDICLPAGGARRAAAAGCRAASPGKLRGCCARAHWQL